MWTLSGEGRNSVLQEKAEEVKLPMDMQSKNSMVDVARNKAAIDYCAYLPAVFHSRVCLWWDSRARLELRKAQLLLFRGNILTNDLTDGEFDWRQTRQPRESDEQGDKAAICNSAAFHALTLLYVSPLSHAHLAN